MQTLRIETTIPVGGEIRLSRLPFRTGEQVEITLVSQGGYVESANPFPLRGLPFEYVRPTDPVAEDDWDALR